MEYLCENGHFYVMADELSVKEQLTLVPLLTVEGMNPSISLGAASLHDNLLMLIAARRCLKPLLVQPHGHVRPLMGTILFQLREGEEQKYK